MKTKTRKDLLAEIEELRTRLEVAEETLRTLQEGDKAMLKEIAHLKKTNETLAQLASFPELNPSPVMEVDLAGNVHYLNLAAKQLFPDPQTIGLHHPYLSDLSSLTETFKHQEKSSIIRELKINNSWYEQAIYYVSENNRLRIYGHDITEPKQIEEKLRAQAQIIDQIHDAVIGTDLDGYVSGWNKGAERMFGYLAEEALGKNISFIYPPGQHEFLQKEVIRPLKEKGHHDTEVRLRRKSSEDFYAHLSLSLLKNPKGLVTGMIGYSMDITEHKRMEEALRSNVARYRGLYEAVSSGVVVQDRNGIIIEANAVACKILGLTFDQLQGRTSLDHQWHAIHEDGSPFPGEDHPSMLTLRTGRAIRGTVMGVFNPGTDNYRWILINSEPILDPAISQVQAVVTSFLDITEQKQVEEKLKYSERKYRELYEGSHDGFVMVDMEGHIKEFNHAYMEMLGYSKEELMRLTYMDLTPQKWHAMEAKIIKDQVLSKGYSTVYEKEYIKKDRTIFPISLRNYLIKDTKGDFKGMWAFVRDITKRKEMEEALRRSRDELEIRVQKRTTELANAYKELKNQSRILESFFKYTITPLVFLDRDFNFIRVNEAYAKACQREVSEFPGHNHFEFYPSDAKAKFEQVVQTKEPYAAIAKPFTFPDHPKWGETYWDWTLTPILDDAGEVEYLVFSLRDVTIRKRAEDAVKAERQRFNDVLEILPAYLILLAPDYHVSFTNRFFRQRFGESYGRRCFEYLFGRNEPCEICESYTVLKTMAPHGWEWTGPDGRIYDVFDFPFTDSDGSTLILEMGIDITERKQAEEQLKTTSLYARSLIEASLDPLVTISRDGKIMDVNSSTELIAGVPRNQLIGSDFSDYFTEPEKAQEGYQQVFKTGSVRDYPLAIRHTSGRITDVLYNATLYKNEMGEVQGVFAAARDITKRKQAEEALKESESRLRSLSSQLLTVQENERKRVARELHDGIGQLLTAIKFKVENIFQEKGERKTGAKEKSLEDIIPIIKESIEEVRRIQMDLRPSILDDLGILATLEWFCREYQKIYSHIYIEKKINLQENDVSLPLKTAIYRVTQEAMNNIAKHSQADSVHLSLRKKENTIELTIKDNGTGFDLEEILSPERSKRGLGLNSMRERTELLGGSFVVESTRGQGTVIRASWPMG